MSIGVIAVGVAFSEPHSRKGDSGRDHVRKRVDGIGYHCGGITENAREQLKGCKEDISAHSDSGDLPGNFLPIRNAAVLARLRVFIINRVGFDVFCHDSNSLGREQCLLATRARVRKIQNAPAERQLSRRRAQRCICCRRPRRPGSIAQRHGLISLRCKSLSQRLCGNAVQRVAIL